MSELPNESVQVCITSPPYWGLRKYAGNQTLIWGDNHCEHKWDDETHRMDYVQGNPDFARPHREKKSFSSTTSICSLCGTWRGAYGLEPIPELYIQHTIEILREIKRILRKDGVCFWNCGDSYAGSNSGKGDYREKKGLQKDIYDWEHPQSQTGKWDKWRRGIGGEEYGVSLSGVPVPPTLKSKYLCLIPFRVAVAGREDGWWVRSVIILSKNNPMPESVTDRPTESHEYILLLTKNKNYYWDAEAVREKYSDVTLNDHRVGRDVSRGGIKEYELAGVQNPSDVRARIFNNLGTGRNIRSVWEFPTQPYPEAHFAVFPEKLPKICIKAATPEIGCCDKCGKPWVRIRKPTKEYAEALERLRTVKDRFPRFADDRHSAHAPDDNQTASYETIDWQQACKCKDSKPVPSIVLDPFTGSGTTLWVAKKLGRKAVGYEISEEYCQLALDRNRQGALL